MFKKKLAMFKKNIGNVFKQTLSVLITLILRFDNLPVRFENFRL